MTMLMMMMTTYLFYKFETWLPLVSTKSQVLPWPTTAWTQLQQLGMFLNNIDK